MAFPSEQPSSPEDSRRFIMMVFSLVREIEAIGWYEQQMAAEPNSSVRMVMQIGQKEEFKHLVLLLQAMLIAKPEWRRLIQQALFTEGLSAGIGEAIEVGPPVH
jgi:hypothetical protein